MTAARIAVLGAGLIGRKHISVLRAGRPDYTLAAVADPAPAAKAEAQQLGYPIYDTLEEMLDHAKPDGVVIAVPNQAHVTAGLACIARGIPVIVEKPIADSLAAGRQLVEAGERAGVGILTGHHRRHNPIMRKAAEIVRSGVLGRIVAVNGLWLSRKPEDYFDIAWRRQPGGGPVLINAIHDIDCLRMLCGDITTVQAATSHAARNFVVEDTAAATLTFANGALGTLLVSDTAAGPWSWEWGSRENPARPYEPENAYLVVGTRGSLAVPGLQLRLYEPGHETWDLPMTQTRLHVALEDAYFEQMRNFTAVIRGTEIPAISGRGGLETLATTLAITESARVNGPVDVAAYLASAT